MATSYIPLYRKYRPQKFSDLIGQETVVKTLSNAINFDKVAHAYLFTGSRGTGKTSTARILAKSLNCIEGPTVEPCGRCPSCIDIANSNSIDVIEIDAASNGSVEAARNLIDKIQFMPVAGKYKVYIIDEVHMLSNQAFNTLLKTLEEPPKNLVFILATTESHKVLTTIISRCQRFDFKRVNQDLISAKLKEIAKQEDIKINDKAISVISRRCHGGMRDALGLLDQTSVLSSLQDEITENDIISLMGSMSEDTLFKMADSLADKNISSLITLIEEISVINEPVQVVRELINYFRNALFVKTADNLENVKDIIDLSKNILPALKEQVGKFEINEIVQIIEKLAACERTLKHSSQQLLWLEVGFIGICHRHDIQVIKELESRILRLEEALSSGNMPAVKPVNFQPKPIEITKPVEIPKAEPVKQVVEAVAITTNPCEAVVKSIKDNINEKPQPEELKELKITLEVSETIPEIKEKITIEEDILIIEPETEEIQEASVSAIVPSVNLADSWKILLENLESVPARSFFSGLSKPVEINSQKIVITFKGENFVKQAKDTGKIAPLEKAAEKMFGVLPRVIVRTPLPEDALAQKKNEELKSSLKPVPAAPKSQQISTPLIEEIPKPQKAHQVVIDEKPVSDAEKEISEEIEEVKADIKPVNLSEQAKLVLDLFNGKVIDS